MPVIQSLRRLDDRFVLTGGKASDRALRCLPWVLVVALLAHFATLFIESRLLEGVVSGLLLSSALTAFTYLQAARRDRK